jgi:hypothetical protein
MIAASPSGVDFYCRISRLRGIRPGIFRRIGQDLPSIGRGVRHRVLCPRAPVITPEQHRRYQPESAH